MPVVTSEELLEEWDWESGTPTGRPVTRAGSYRMGIPHEGVHLWIVKNTEGCHLLFQQRSSDKELFPDCLDITVGGHVPFGFRGNKVRKEALEEIGRCPAEETMKDLGCLRFEEKTADYHHREFQHVFIALDNSPLDSYEFNDGEVAGIYSVPVVRLRSLMEKDSVFTVQGYDGVNQINRDVSRKDFHPLLFSEKMRHYMEVVISGAEELSENGEISVTMSGRC